MTITDYFDINELSLKIKEYDNLNNTQKNSFSERDVCTKFILQLLKILKWDINNINEVKEEASAGKGFIDISVMIYGITKLIIENKKFGTLDGKTVRRGKTVTFEEQVLDYAWQKKVDWAILTNFEEIRLFFTHVKTPKHGKMISIKYNQLQTKEGIEFLKRISKKGISEGLLNNLALKRERLPIDEEFSKKLLQIRNDLREDIIKNNGYTPDELHPITQRIIDRLIMIRSAEDWNVIASNNLKNTIEYWEKNTIDLELNPLYDVIKMRFKEFDKVYNTKIFAQHKCDEIELSNSVLKGVILEFYSFNFDEIGVDILGNVYEEYLGHVLQELKGKVTINSEYLNKQKLGIFYTKQYIVKYIVNKAISDKINSVSDKEDLEKLRVIDISCGSGSFLIESFNLLENKYFDVEKKKYSKPVELEHYFLEQRAAYYWKEILKNNLFGIDVDHTATELASANLSLRALTKNEKLPLILEQNILTRDSLLLQDREFSEWIQNYNKFDFIIGNPPYILGDDLSREIHEKLKSNYSEIYAAEADYCYYFLSKGIDLLRNGGRLGFILARYFMKSFYGEKIREKILKEGNIKEIIDFGNLDVFEGIGSRCCIFIFEKNKEISTHNEIRVIRFKKRKFKGSKEKVLTQILEIDNELKTKQYFKGSYLDGFFIKQDILGKDPWILSPSLENNLLDKLKTKFPSLKELNFMVGEGGICGLEAVFRIDNSEYITNSFEPTLWKPEVKTKNIRAYSLESSEAKILYADNIEDFSDFDKYPKTKAYLLKNIDKLAFKRIDYQPSSSKFSRKVNNILKIIGQRTKLDTPFDVKELEKVLKNKFKIKNPNEVLESIIELDFVQENNGKLFLDYLKPSFHNFWKWWKWTSPRNIDLFKNVKILTPYISEENNFMVDFDGRFSVSAAVIGIAFPEQESEKDYNYLLGLLNSRLYSFLHQQRAKQKDYRFEYFPTPLLELPFPIKDYRSNKKELSEKVEKLIQLKKKKTQIEFEFERILKNNSVEREEKFQSLWDVLSNINIQKNKAINGDPLVNSIALDVMMEKKRLEINCFYDGKWHLLILLEDKNSNDSYLYYIYLMLNAYLNKNQVPSKKSWRKGKIFSDILLNKIVICFKKKISVEEMFKNTVPSLIKELKLNLGSIKEDLWEIDNQIKDLDENINQIVYKIYDVSQDDIKIIENYIEYNVPYLP